MLLLKGHPLGKDFWFLPLGIKHPLWKSQSPQAAVCLPLFSTYHHQVTYCIFHYLSYLVCRQEILHKSLSRLNVSVTREVFVCFDLLLYSQHGEQFLVLCRHSKNRRYEWMNEWKKKKKAFFYLKRRRDWREKKKKSLYMKGCPKMASQVAQWLKTCLTIQELLLLSHFSRVWLCAIP